MAPLAAADLIRQATNVEVVMGSVLVHTMMSLDGFIAVRTTT
jgi:hypothetical protein